MKGTAILELVIILVFFMGAVPLLMVLLVHGNDVEYLTDKSVTNYVVEYNTRDEVMDSVTLKLNAAQCIYLPLINDNYCPYPGKVTFMEDTIYTSQHLNTGQRESLVTKLHENYPAQSSYYTTIDLKTPNYRQSSKSEFDKWNSTMPAKAGVWDYILNNNTMHSVPKYTAIGGISGAAQGTQAYDDAMGNSREWRMYLYQKTLPDTYTTYLPGGLTHVDREWVISSYLPHNQY